MFSSAAVATVRRQRQQGPTTVAAPAATGDRHRKRLQCSQVARRHRGGRGITANQPLVVSKVAADGEQV
jgi:hypothetical protein